MENVEPTDAVSIRFLRRLLLKLEKQKQNPVFLKKKV